MCGTTGSYPVEEAAFLAGRVEQHREGAIPRALGIVATDRPCLERHFEVVLREHLGSMIDSEGSEAEELTGTVTS
jgi:hypothetical protein